MIRTVQLVVSKRIFARLRARIRYNLKRCKMNAILMSLLIFSVIQDGFFVHITLSLLIQIVYFNLKKNPHNYDTCFRFFIRFILHCLKGKAYNLPFYWWERYRVYLHSYFSFFNIFIYAVNCISTLGICQKKKTNTCSLRWNLYFNFQTFSCHWLIFTTCRKVDLNKKKMNISLRHNNNCLAWTITSLNHLIFFGYYYGTIKDI